ncbi:MAG: ATP-binding protein [Clostridiales bacterium]|nr:ATP-binding protein [Clostridiales bacterium]
MGIYLNPGNISFQQIRNSIYVDKTGMIAYLNSTINTPDKLTCVSRPRRFGKSFAAKMICAYYDKNCDSREMFSDLKIAQTPSFEKYLNTFHVIYLDITRFLSRLESAKFIIRDIQDCVICELRKMYPDIIGSQEHYLPDALAHVTQETGEQFFIIIDEWDALFRETSEDADAQKNYIRFLRGLFKGGPATDLSIAGAYMTGILPIKKYGTQSAMTDFREFTMVDSPLLTEYAGFTEEEVRTLCGLHGANFDDMKLWYDGYSFPGCPSIYSPNSVISAIRYQKFANYWTASETYESLKAYIRMDFDGLKDAVIAMLGGLKIRIDTLGFQNDMTSIRNRDDVLTLLVHLGYLAYDETSREVSIPNLEVADSFRLAVQDSDWAEVGKAIRESEDLLSATINGDNKTVANALEKIHESTSSILQYNDENSLSCALTIAYYTASRSYTIIRELPAGKGFADLAFLPHKGSNKPAMIIELKYNKSADSAIHQIKDNRYDGVLKSWGGKLLLVGINYEKETKDKNSKRHTCVIEKA